MSIELLRSRESDSSRSGVPGAPETGAHAGTAPSDPLAGALRDGQEHHVRVCLPPLIDGVEKTANETFVKAIQVQASVDHDLREVTGDPVQLHQVLIHLCVNARDAMPEGGVLKIKVRNTVVDETLAGRNPGASLGPHCLIEISDTGCGMDEVTRLQIFDPFYTTKEQGTGLGLFSSLAIVKSHGGFIEVKSARGCGTTVSFHLPAAKLLTAGPDLSPPLPARAGKGELVLVVDDEPLIREITRKTVQMHGYTVITAENGLDAVAKFSTRGEEVSLVLTDLMMPQMDGATAIGIIKEINPRVKIIAASGVNEEGQVSRVLRAGADAFLPKPYTAETLVSTMAELLDEAAFLPS